MRLFGVWVALICVAASAPLSAQAIPGTFYEYYVVAKTGATYTQLGGAPSINERRQVAFQGAIAAGNALWLADGSATPVNFNPAEIGQTATIGSGVQLSTSGKVVNLDRISSTTPPTTAIRLYNANLTDSWIYAARGGPFETNTGTYLYDAVFANPAVNNNGDVVFTAFHPTPTKVLGYLAASSTSPVEVTITSSNPKPVIADSGVVAIVVGTTTFQLKAYGPGLTSPQIIADTSGHWVSLDNDPGISRDGRIIAFQGNPDAVQAAAMGTTTGAGIFVAIDENGDHSFVKILRVTGSKVEDVAADRAAMHGNYDGICDIGEICKPAAELGFDGAGQPITLASYGIDSRVGVANVDFGAAGIDDDSFVVSFIATPSSASRNNPTLPGTPLLFSSQQGLWTIRVDVQHDLGAPSTRTYHPFTPIPVVQVGDKIGTDTVTGIGVYDPIANAAHDENGNIRTMRRGDHRVAFWASTASGSMIVRANHLDSDQDGLLDHWETSGIDMDHDGSIDLSLANYGADPFNRDLFLQVDWVGKPGSDQFKPAGAVFPSDIAGQYSIFEANLRNAEALSGPLYGARIDGSSPIDIHAGVTPHVDAGFAIDSVTLPMSINMGGGPRHGGNYVGMPGDPNTLPDMIYYGQPGLTVPGVNVRSYQEIKDSFFGTSDKDARLLAFHYMVFAPFQDFYPNYPATPYSATITNAPSPGTVILDQPVSSFPQLRSGGFAMLTSGAAAKSVRQISSRATDGVSGNAALILSAPFSPAPSVGDTMVFFDGSTGLAEVAFAPTPDNNSLPGNDVIVSAGAMGVLQGVPPNTCMEGETASHELGHTLGLRHGGTDHVDHKPGADYQSVMSYTWQLECTPTPQQPNYSHAGDTTFDDYAHLQFNFSDVQFQLATSLGEARGEGYPNDMQQQQPEQNLLDVIAKNGPLDSTPPTVSITSPSSGGAVAIAGNVTVTVTASDNQLLSRVTIAFDTNGNGVTDGGEAVNATPLGGNLYQAVFSNVGGSAGARSIKAVAWDGWSNTAVAAINVNVGNVVQVAVPNVVGQTKAAATTAITGAGLVVGTITTQSSAIVPAGSVISENPPAATMVNSGSAVNLVISGSQPTAMIPNSGSAGRQVFTFTVQDAGGAASILYAQFLFAKTAAGINAVNGCYISYAPSQNAFYLLSDDATAWYGLLGGTANTTGNAQCEIHGATSGSTAAGNNLTVTVDISFRSGFAGAKNAYEFSGDTLGTGSGWVMEGTWNDTGDLNVVEVTAVSPLPGSGLNQTLTATIKDGAGANTIQFVELVMTPQPVGSFSGNGCFIFFAPAANVFFLLNDAATAFSGLIAGSGSVSNSHCTLQGTGSGGSASGSTLTVTYNLTFSAGFTATSHVYMQAADAVGNLEVWHDAGTDTP